MLLINLFLILFFFFKQISDKSTQYSPSFHFSISPPLVTSHFFPQWLRNCKDTFPRCPGDSVVTCQPGDSEEKVCNKATYCNKWVTILQANMLNIWVNFFVCVCVFPISLLLLEFCHTEVFFLFACFLCVTCFYPPDSLSHQ